LIDNLLSVESEKFFTQADFTLNWVLHRRCNYRCSYCTARDNRGYMPDMRQLRAAVAKIHALPHDRLNIFLTGGEPTLHPDYHALVQLLCSDPRVRLITQTNLSQPIGFYEGLPQNQEFLASLHYDQVTPAEFLGQVAMVRQAGWPVHAWIMAHPERFAEVRQLEAELGHLAEFKMLVHWSGPRRGQPDQRYGPEYLEWLRSLARRREPFLGRLNLTYASGRVWRGSPEQAIEHGLNRFRGMVCAAGRHSASIHVGGEIDRAVCFRRSGRSQGGNAFLSGSFQFTEPIICPAAECRCGNDVAIPKWRRGGDDL
jgi:hypothetical protein